MRRNALACGLAIVVAGGLCLSAAFGQFPGGGKKGFGGGGNQFGGGGGNPFGGGGGSPFGGGGGGAAGMLGDPSRTFDFLAKGRPYFLVSETRSLRAGLEQYLAQKGINNGQVTRELFTGFSEQMKTSMAGSGGPGAAPKMTFPQGGPNMFSMTPGGQPGMGSPSPFGGPQDMGMSMRAFNRNPLDAMNQYADAEFNRRDLNGDGVLNLDEMPDAVKNDLGRFDTNHDNLIDLNEFRVYFMARLQGGGDGRQANPVTIILEEEFDKRPTVFRAGKLPKELRWFEDLDIDKDGQVALWEWRRADKDMEDFATYDRNEDGFITPEEALRLTSARNNGAGRGGDEGDETSSNNRSSFSMPGANPWMQRGSAEDNAKMANWMKDFGKKKKDMGDYQGGGGNNKKKKGTGFPFGGGN